jgi:hypothetical protein
MDYFAGLDVSVKETSVCIVDDAGKIEGSSTPNATPRLVQRCCRCAIIFMT